MTPDRLTIVTAEGSPGRSGLLRYVLESEGYAVAGEASSAAALAQQVAQHHPDVVVMDDGIGVTAVSMVREMAPGAKVVLVWPSAVVPVGGDARVDPSETVRELGPTIERLTGVASATGSMRGGAGLPAAEAALGLGGILAIGRAADAGEPHEVAAAGPPSTEAIIDDHESPPVLILPPEPAMPAAAGAAALGADAAVEAGTAAEPEALAPAAAGAAAAAVVAVPTTAWVRRLGTLALGGVAVAGSLFLGIALSGSQLHAQHGAQGPVPTATGTPSRPSNPPPPTTHTGTTSPGSLLGRPSGGTRPSPQSVVLPPFGGGTTGPGGGGTGTSGGGGGNGGGSGGGTGTGGGAGGAGGGGGGGQGGSTGGGGGGTGGGTGGGGNGGGGGTGGGGGGTGGGGGGTGGGGGGTGGSGRHRDHFDHKGRHHGDHDGDCDHGHRGDHDGDGHHGGHHHHHRHGEGRHGHHGDHDGDGDGHHGERHHHEGHGHREHPGPGPRHHH